MTDVEKLIERLEAGWNPDCQATDDLMEEAAVALSKLLRACELHEGTIASPEAALKVADIDSPLKGDPEAIRRYWETEDGELPDFETIMSEPYTPEPVAPPALDGAARYARDLERAFNPTPAIGDVEKLCREWEEHVEYPGQTMSRLEGMKLIGALLVEALRSLAAEKAWWQQEYRTAHDMWEIAAAEKAKVEEELRNREIELLRKLEAVVCEREDLRAKLEGEE